MKISFAGTLLRFVDFQKSIEIGNPPTLRSALEFLVAKYPDIKPILFSADGDKLRPVHQIFVSGQMILPTDLDRALTMTDDIQILTAIAGG